MKIAAATENVRMKQIDSGMGTEWNEIHDKIANQWEKAKQIPV